MRNWRGRCLLYYEWREEALRGEEGDALAPRGHGDEHGSAVPVVIMSNLKNKFILPVNTEVPSEIQFLHLPPGG